VAWTAFSWLLLFGEVEIMDHSPRNNLKHFFFVQTFNLIRVIRGYENATATPVSHFHPLSISYIGSSPNSTCSFSDYSTLLKQELLFHESVHILHYFTPTTPFYPILPGFKRHFQADNDFSKNSINTASWCARPCKQEST